MSRGRKLRRRWLQLDCGHLQAMYLLVALLVGGLLKLIWILHQNGSSAGHRLSGLPATDPVLVSYSYFEKVTKP